MGTSGCYYCVQVCSYQVWQRETTGCEGHGREGEGGGVAGQRLGDDGKDTGGVLQLPYRLGV